MLTRIRVRIPALTLVVASLAACGNPTAPIRLAEAPDEFTFSSGGFFAERHTYEVRGDTIVFRRSLPFQTPPVRVDSLRRIPSPDEWRRFWTAAEVAGVHRWKAEYRQPGVFDGEGFTLHLRAAGRTINTSGSNAYPDRRGVQRFETPVEFTGFVAAMDALIGRRQL